MKLLVLGGTEEGRLAATALTAAGHQVTYSLAGRTPPPSDLPCPVRVGGFSGGRGLAQLLTSNDYEGVIDACHPYAKQIHHHAAEAARETGLPLWRWQRPRWHPVSGDRWRYFPTWETLLAALPKDGRILFTVGASAYRLVMPHHRPKQRWFIRAITPPPPLPEGVTGWVARGPFPLDEELGLLARLKVDVLVSKDSGGSAVAAKLTAARQLGLTVFFLERPALPATGIPIDTLPALLKAIAATES